MRRENFQVDWLASNSLVVTSDPGCLVLNFPLDVAKVSESPVGYVMELGPLVPCSLRGISVGGRDPVVGILLGHIDKLEDERSSGDDSATTGKKVATDNVFKDRRLSGRLRTYNNL